MPGRCESWTEQVAYLGNGRWRLRIEGSNFQGTEKESPNIEDFTTLQMMGWVERCDKESGDGSSLRTKALRTIAKKVGCDEYFKIIQEFERPQRKSPRKIKGPAPKVVKIINKKQKSVWIRTKVTWYEVETTAGLGTLHSAGIAPANKKGKIKWKLLVNGNCWKIPLTKTVLQQIESLK